MTNVLVPYNPSGILYVAPTIQPFKKMNLVILIINMIQYYMMNLSLILIFGEIIEILMVHIQTTLIMEQM